MVQSNMSIQNLDAQPEEDDDNSSDISSAPKNVDNPDIGDDGIAYFLLSITLACAIFVVFIVLNKGRSY